MGRSSREAVGGKPAKANLRLGQPRMDDPRGAAMFGCGEQRGVM